MHPDDRYTEGVWYDTMNGDFCEIQESQDGELVELVNPENGNVYWDMTKDEWADEQSDFRQISEDAVDDPVAVVRRAVRILARNDVNEMAGVPMQEAIDLRFARQQVEIQAKE